MEDELLSLARQLSDLAPHVWRIAVRRVYAEIAALVWRVVWLVPLLVIWFRLSPILWNKGNDRVETDEDMGVVLGFILIFGWVAFVFGLMVSLSTIQDILVRAISPEYFAIEYLKALLP